MWLSMQRYQPSSMMCPQECWPQASPRLLVLILIRLFTLSATRNSLAGRLTAVFSLHLQSCQRSYAKKLVFTAATKRILTAPPCRLIFRPTVWKGMVMQRLSRSLSRFETQDITYGQMNVHAAVNLSFSFRTPSISWLAVRIETRLIGSQERISLEAAYRLDLY